MQKYSLNLILVILFICVLYSESTITQKANRVFVRVQFLKMCETDADSPQKVVLSFHRVNATDMGASMNWTASEAFDDSYTLTVKVSKFEDGKWKKNYLTIKKKDACSELYKLLGPLMEDITHEAHMKAGCPVQPGFYKFENMTRPIGIPQGPLLSRPGKFYFVFQISKDYKTAICIDTQLDIKKLD